METCDFACNDLPHIGVGRGAREPSPQFLAHIVILRFETGHRKQHSIIRLKSNILANPDFWPPQKVWAGYATASTQATLYCSPNLCTGSSNRYAWKL